MLTKNIKTIAELSQLEGRVYVNLPTEALALQFMQQAEAEGFTFEDGVRPTERIVTAIMAVNSNRTINYVGAIGHMVFGAGVKTVGGRVLMRFSYVGNRFIPYKELTLI